MPILMTDLFNDDGKPKRLIDIEREMLKVLMDKCNGNVYEVAKIMGVGNKQAYRRLFKTGLYTPKQFREKEDNTSVLSAKQAGKVKKLTLKVKEHHWV